MAQQTLTAVRSALSIELGEQTVPAPWPAYRDSCIQWSLERIARFYDFDFSRKMFTGITDANGILTLDPSVEQDPDIDIQQVIGGTDNNNVFQETSYAEFDKYVTGDYRYYKYTEPTTGVQFLYTTEPNMTVNYLASLGAQTLTDASPVDFPSALAIAKGALIYAREYEDKDADVSVEDAKFMQIMQEVIANEQRNKKPGRAVGIQEQTGYYTGQVTGNGGDQPMRDPGY